MLIVVHSVRPGDCYIKLIQLDKKRKEYEIPDEKTSYPELKVRIRREVIDTLPKKERVIPLAKKTEDDLTIKDTTYDQVCADLKAWTKKQK